MTYVTWDFPPIKVHRTKRGRCYVCGRSVQRTRTFAHTVNPFHPAVTPGMDVQEAERAVLDAARAEADAWEPDFTHAACAGWRPQGGEEAAA